MARVIRRPPEYCPMCHSAEIASTGTEKTPHIAQRDALARRLELEVRGLQVRVGPGRL